MFEKAFNDMPFLQTFARNIATSFLVTQESCEKLFNVSVLAGLFIYFFFALSSNMQTQIYTHIRIHFS